MKARLACLYTVGLFGLTAPLASYATNGYFAIGFGAASESMGGAGVAYPQTSLAVGANPAGLTQVGTRADVGAGIFVPRRCSGEVGLFGGSADASGAALCEKSSSNLFVVPSMGFSFAFNDKLSLGIAALGNGGMNTTYDPNFFSLGGSTKYLGVDLVQLFVPITVAWKPVKSQTFGVSLVPARARFAAQGLQAFKSYSSDPDHVTNKGHDYANGMGLRVGWLGYFMKNRLSLGATYATRTYMHKFDLYSGLFAGNGSFDVPTNFALGAAFKVTPDVDVAFDVERIMYAQIPSIGNPGPTNYLYSGNPIYDSATHKLGQPNGMGFGWQNQTVYKLGVLYRYDDNWTFRAGYNYGKSPIPNDQILFNLLAPGVVERHYTAGFTYNLGPQSIMGFGSEGEVTFSFMHAARKRQQATLLFDNTTPVTAVAEMYQNSWTLAYGLKF